MNPEHDRKYIRVKKITLIVALLVVAAGLLGWRLGRSKPSTSQTSPAATQPSPLNNKDFGVKSFVSYVLPDGWKEAGCPAATDSVYIAPNGSVDCSANPPSAVKISVDPSSSKDCNDLQNVQDVKKHICISLYINGRKTLKSTTEYLASSSYKKPTTINAYYVDTGKDVVKLEYIYNSDNQYQAGFDQLAQSIKIK